MTTTLINSTPIAIIYRDGQTETIELKVLTIRQLYQFIEHFGQSNTPALVALSVGKDLDWIDTLSDASFGDLAKASIKQNFPRTETMISQDVTVAARLAPILQCLAQAESMFAGEHSNAKSPAPAASVSAAESGSAAST